MERAGAEAALAGLSRFPDAERWTIVCGGGSNVSFSYAPTGASAR